MISVFRAKKKMVDKKKRRWGRVHPAAGINPIRLDFLAEGIKTRAEAEEGWEQVEHLSVVVADLNSTRDQIFFFLHLVVFHWPFQSRFRTVRFKPMHQSMAVCVPVANSEQFQSLNSSEFNVMDWGNEFRAVSEQPLNWLKTQWIQW